MPLFNVFKNLPSLKLRRAKKKTKPKVKPVKKPAEEPVKKVKPVEKPVALKEKTVLSKKERRTIKGEAYQSLKSPHVTEKATDLAKQNLYVFKVWPRANKITIRKAIEDLYGVDVMSVKIIKVPPKKRKLGKIKGWRKGYKKAAIKIKGGQKIEVLPR